MGRDAAEGGEMRQIPGRGDLGDTEAFLKHAVGDGGIGTIKKPEDALLALRQDGAAARGRVRQGFGKRFPFFKKYTRSWMGNMELIMNGDVFAEAVGEAYWSVFP